MREVAELLNATRDAGVISEYSRILGLLESGEGSREQIARLAGQHGLADAWARFQARFLDE